MVPVERIGRRQKTFGKKALSIQWLAKHQFATPASWAIDASQALHWSSLEQLPENALETFERLLDSKTALAIRSSANVEDSQSSSYAGQFDSVLNVTSIEDVLPAIKKVVESASTQVIQSYKQTRNDNQAVDMGVLVQAMVEPQYSGVAFSKNPITGFDEVIIEAVEGSGAQLVQDGVTPMRWVNKWGKWLSESDGHLSSDVLQRVLSDTLRMQKRYGEPVDAEWVFDGSDLYWVQVRPITSLNVRDRYSNRISKEVLPGAIKPLIWSVNVPMVNRAWIDLFTELIGENTLSPDRLSKAFYYRAYFNMGLIGDVFKELGFPEASLELMMGLQGGDEKPGFRPGPRFIRHVPRLIRFARHKWRFSKDIERELPIAKATFQQFAGEDLESLTNAGLLISIEKLSVEVSKFAYYNIVGPILAQAYDAILRKQLSKADIDSATVDMTADEPRLRDYDANIAISALQAEWATLDENEQAQWRSVETIDQASQLQRSPFQQALMAFLDDFGHNSESGNDFSKPPWRHQLSHIWQLVDHHTAPGSHSGKTRFEQLELTGKQRRKVKRWYRRATRFRLHREQISAQYTFGYGLFRDRFECLGRRLVDDSKLSQTQDIYFLTHEEVSDLTQDKLPVGEAGQRIARRRQEMSDYEDIALPDLIHGDQPPPLELTFDESAHQQTGTASSPGYYRGTARVVTSADVFYKVQPGDVIVIPYSDVGWTPLFSRAGAVIAESGGMLSHSSIVAREYGIPAVVSVNHACQWIQDGDLIAVDGFKGVVAKVSQSTRSEEAKA
ncbi:MAG: PEP/pyruvate-binding domain-containing protein [Woeseiaceae bacterium]|nr:PEP/pyruvate-binding domain-containing protein [Woeseiaceae bacterium]